MASGRNSSSGSDAVVVLVAGSTTTTYTTRAPFQPEIVFRSSSNYDEAKHVNMKVVRDSRNVLEGFRSFNRLVNKDVGSK